MKNAIVYVNETTAQVTKAFQKNACIFGTEEFKLWREYKKEFPNAVMFTKSIKKNADQKRRRNKTYENMEAFINTRQDAETLMKEFEAIKQRSKIQKSPYQYVLDWFEAKFEDYDDLTSFMKEKDEDMNKMEQSTALSKLEDKQ